MKVVDEKWMKMISDVLVIEGNTTSSHFLLPSIKSWSPLIPLSSFILYADWLTPSIPSLLHSTLFSPSRTVDSSLFLPLEERCLRQRKRYYSPATPTVPLVPKPPPSHPGSLLWLRFALTEQIGKRGESSPFIPIQNFHNWKIVFQSTRLD